jgi:hypothetical protein
MPTRQRRLQQLPEFNRGEWTAARIHVGVSNREVVRICRSRIAPQFHRTRLFRDQRHAFYLGALKALGRERQLMRQFRL